MGKHITINLNKIKELIKDIEREPSTREIKIEEKIRKFLLEALESAKAPYFIFPQNDKERAIAHIKEHLPKLNEAIDSLENLGYIIKVIPRLSSRVPKSEAFEIEILERINL